MAKGFVYKWVNNLNKMWYSGSHEGNVDDGYIGYGCKLNKNGSVCFNTKSKNYAFIKDVIKFGIENFTRHIIYKGDDFRLVEDLHLKSHNAKDDPLCYNIKNNAWDHINGKPHYMIGKNHLESTKQKMSESALGRENKHMQGDKHHAWNVNSYKKIAQRLGVASSTYWRWKRKNILEEKIMEKGFSINEIIIN